MSAIVATLPVPPSANHLFANKRDGGRVKTKDYDAWLEEARWHLKRAWAACGSPSFGDQPMRLSIAVGIDRGRDVSNCCKAIEDAMVKFLPVPDDRWNDYIALSRRSEIDGLADIRLEPLNST